MSEQTPPEGGGPAPAQEPAESATPQTPPAPPGEEPVQEPAQELAEEPVQEPAEPPRGKPPAGRGGPREGPPPDRAQPRPAVVRPSVIVRYGLMRKIGQFRHNIDPPPARGTKVVIRTERGVELGEVIIAISDEPGSGRISAARLREFTDTNGPEYPMRRDGKILRLANPQDEIDHRHLQGSAGEEAAYCREQIEQLGLAMKLVTVEHLLGGERIVFYFAAEHRVDFRELVRHLASQYRTRIEMRQVGARDEARLVADYERCGQPCCCQRYLKDLKPVAMRMAKTQKATLDPSKISGRCGRLMCCLRYEDAAYEDLQRRLPRKGTWVRTADVVGKVIETQILTQLIRLQLPDNSRVVVANEEIVERDVEQPEAPPAPRRREPARRRPVPRRPLRARAESAAASAQDRPADATPEAGAEARPAQPVGAPHAGPPDAAEAGKPKRRRRRRPRRRKPAGAEGDAQAARGGAPEAAPPQARRRKEPPQADRGEGPPPGEPPAEPADQTPPKTQPDAGQADQAQPASTDKPRRRPKRRRGRRRRKK